MDDKYIIHDGEIQIPKHLVKQITVGVDTVNFTMQSGRSYCFTVTREVAKEMYEHISA